MTEYNAYPKDMKKVDFYSYKDIKDLFIYCWESEESKQAYKNEMSMIECLSENLRIIRINKKLNLGFAFGNKESEISVYKIGNDENWRNFNLQFFAKFHGDNS